MVANYSIGGPMATMISCRLAGSNLVHKCKRLGWKTFDTASQNGVQLAINVAALQPGLKVRRGVPA
jgi:hypothetical protein